MANRDLLGKTRIDPAQPEFRALFENLQGNIVKPHARDHAVLFFFRIKTGKRGAARSWIRAFAAKHVTSARRQWNEARRLKRSGIPGRTFCGLLLSASGYRALGVPLPPDPKFRAGMKRSGPRLKDPSPRSWDPAYRREIHGLVLLADNGQKRLGHLATAVRKQTRAFAEVVAVERGRQWHNKANQVVEHFGYADGRSQPVFLRADFNEEAKKRDGIDLWDPSAPLRLVLVRDPNVHAPDAYGSYLVFRKLEQNVRAFRRRARMMATKLTDDVDGTLAGAYMVGRFEDGTPVKLRPSPDPNAARAAASNREALNPRNNFIYAGDSKGSRCPFQAHIRAANPRNKGTRAQRIVRRGIPYGARRTSPHGKGVFTDAPTRGVGLLFMCLQGSIANQFERMQKRMNEQGGHPQDPVTGQGRRRAIPLWPASYDTPSRMRYPPRGTRAESLVRLRGGEYFFAPSLPFLTGF